MKITINLSNCKNYDSFFGTCNLYSYISCNYDHSDNEEKNCMCRDIKNCDYKKKSIREDNK